MHTMMHTTTHSTLVRTPAFASRLPAVGTTIFTVMSALAQQHDAVNLGQGFPDFDCDRRLLDQVGAAMHEGLNQYPPMAGVALLRQAVSAKIEALYGRHYDADSEITVTAGATQAILTAILCCVHPGDEVIVLEPAYDSYAPNIELAGGRAVRVPLTPGRFRPDFGLIAAALSARTRAIIVNSPNNPTGRIYRPAELAALARLLEAASERHGRPITLLSDEAYNRIVFDGIEFESAAQHYGPTITIYTYGKTLLAPGQRVGYAALNPEFPDREAVNYKIFVQQLAAGWGFPNALLQHAMADLEALSVDIDALQRRRDRMVAALT